MKRYLFIVLACLFSLAALVALLSELTWAHSSVSSVDLSMTPVSSTATQWVPFYVRTVITNTDVISEDLRWELRGPSNAMLVSAIGATLYPTMHVPPEIAYWTGGLLPGESHIITCGFQVGIPPIFPAHPDTVVITSTVFDQADSMILVAQAAATVTVDCCWVYLPVVISQSQ